MVIFFRILLQILFVAMFILGFRAIFFAFIKKKDERSKWIVTKSMAECFVIVMILQTILFAVKLINYDFYKVWWSNFKEGIYIEPVMLSVIILGIVLFINTKKHGGSL